MKAALIPEVQELAALSTLTPEQCVARLGSCAEGLKPEEAQARLAKYGPNLLTRERPPSLAQELWRHTSNPLNALLAGLAALSWILGDARAALVIAIMIVLAIATSFVQEHRSNTAAARLQAMVKTTASVRRQGISTDEQAFTEMAMTAIVPGDLVRLSAGDMIPGDLRLLETKDLFINQSALTGESLPSEKFAAASAQPAADPFEMPNMCFMGANVVSGFATGVVIRTGGNTFFGRLADEVAGQRESTAFDRGIARYILLMLRFIAVMAALVFVINGLTKHDWMQALFFAVAVAVGLTPEMLPMIVSVNLAKGAIAMARARVIVKRLPAIQNFGAMDVLCTDKTGTLTQDRIILKRHLDLAGHECDKVLEYAFLNSHYQSGLRNLLDVAVLEHAELHQAMGMDRGYAKVDEIPFDFSRRRMSVVVSRPDGSRVLICKGAVEEVFAACTRYELGDQLGRLDPSHAKTAREEMIALNEDGFRVVAVAYRDVEQQAAYTLADESELVLLGYIAFLDPPKESAAPAIATLAQRGVALKVLTGDNEFITRKVCHEVGLEAGEILLGAQIASMNEAELDAAVRQSRVFAKLSPEQKEHVIRALQRQGHVVGFMGDGINDSPALKSADVGISVDNAVDIAKESADIILLEKDLKVLGEGVLEGRRVFGNITKYIRMGASSNFGNMFSVLGASVFLPFLPMAPIQVLANNLLYDLSQTAIPTDEVDEDYLAQPKRWDVENIFKFMVFIGPISSVFDYLTFAMMLFVFHAGTQPALFQTGWFVESLLTQTLVIHIIRTAKIPFLQSRASAALSATSLLICVVGISLPYSWAADALGFVPLPWQYWPLLVAMLLSYAVLAHLAKSWFARRWGL